MFQVCKWHLTTCNTSNYKYNFKNLSSASPRKPQNLRGWTFFCTFTLWKFTARALAAPRHRKGPSLHRFASVLAPVNKFTPQVGCIPAKFLCSRLAQHLSLWKRWGEIRFNARRTIVRSAPNERLICNDQLRDTPPANVFSCPLPPLTKPAPLWLPRVGGWKTLTNN